MKLILCITYEQQNNQCKINVNSQNRTGFVTVKNVKIYLLIKLINSYLFIILIYSYLLAVLGYSNFSL